MTILVDMDDTIEQLLQAWVRAVNEKYRQSARYEDIRSWDVSAAFPDLTWQQVYGVTVSPASGRRLNPSPERLKLCRG